MQSTGEEQEEVIIRWSGKWWGYLVFHAGFWRALVNTIENTLAVSGRFFLLAYLGYCGAQVGAFLLMPNFTFPLPLEMGMFVLQIAGLEGSIPGLARQADILRPKDEKAAKKLDQAILWSRIMTVSAFGEGAAHALQWDPTFLQYASAVLIVIRGVVITGFLLQLAKIEKTGPRIVSKKEYEAEQEQAEQEQVKIDNTNFREAMLEIVENWAASQPDMKAAFSESIHRLESIVSQRIESTQQKQDEKIESLGRWVESLQFGSSSANSSASIESILPHIESMLSQQVSRVESTLRQHVESTLRDVKRQASRVESTQPVKTAVPVGKKPVERKPAPQELPSNVTPIDRDGAGLTKEELIRLIEKDESLLSLSDSALAQKVGATKSTANRAKKEWYSTHPESTQPGDSEKLEAVN